MVRVLDVVEKQVEKQVVARQRRLQYVPTSICLHLHVLLTLLDRRRHQLRVIMLLAEEQPRVAMTVILRSR